MDNEPNVSPNLETHAVMSSYLTHVQHLKRQMTHFTSLRIFVGG